MRTDVDIPAFKALLEARREELLQAANASAESRQPVELDQTRVGRLSRMDAMQVQAMSIEAERRRNVELTRIEAALNRVADGDYGYCLSCDEAIPVKRLQLDPATPVCIDCARNADGA